MERSNVFDWMKLNGIGKVVVSFSGGNDEGHIDGIDLYDLTGNEVVSDINISGDIEDAFTDPVWEQYGGFAGNFEVAGVVEWNLNTLKVRMMGSEQDWVPFTPREV